MAESRHCSRLTRAARRRLGFLCAGVALGWVLAVLPCTAESPTDESESFAVVDPSLPDDALDSPPSEWNESTVDPGPTFYPPVAFDENWAWRKGEHTLIPYGIGWLNVAWDSERTNNGAFTFFVFSKDIEGKPGFTTNARATRLGLDLTGPPIQGAEYRGKVEIDFFGSAQTENRAGVLLRHAYGEFRTDTWRLLGGQSFDVIAPLNPSMLNYTLGYAAGNIGYRRAQVRYERFLYPSETTLITLQSAFARSIVTDFVTDTELEGHDAGWPTIEARGAMALGTPWAGQKQPEIGLSGHIGQEAVDFQVPPIALDVPFTSWSANLDVHLPLSERWGVQGELFWGDVLGTFLGGINQGIDPITRRKIRSRGGWAEVWFQASDTWHFHAGCGLDDPLDGSLSAGRRSRNQVYYANAVYRFTELFDVGLEVSWWETEYIGLAAGRALRVESVARYRF